MNRRSALRSLGALTAAAAAPRWLTGCAATEGRDRDARVAAGLTNIVVLCMENRSYDHFYGARALLEGRGGDGLKGDMWNPDREGRPVPIFRTTQGCIDDPPHGRGLSFVQMAEGKNDGFVRAYQQSSGGSSRDEVMGYLGREDLPISWALADGGTSCDRWFCSLLGPTWPNRMYLHSGQSGGLTENKLPGAGGLDWPSLWSHLNEAGVPWAYYFSTVPFVPLFRGLDSQGKVRRVDYEFFDDAAAGTLPPVVFIDPAFGVNDDHPPLPPILGQQLIASIYNALAASPQWVNTLFVITYDENGGLFDHVPPPRAADDRAREGFDQLGFRVPTVLAGPYVKPGYVSSVPYDHTSVLAHINRMFGLKALGARDAAARDLSDAIDQARLAAREPLPPLMLPPVAIDPSRHLSGCAASQARNDTARLADELRRVDGRWDRRGEAEAIVRNIARQLGRLERRLRAPA